MDCTTAQKMVLAEAVEPYWFPGIPTHLRSVIKFNKCNEAEISAFPLESWAAPHLPGTFKTSVRAVFFLSSPNSFQLAGNTQGVNSCSLVNYILGRHHTSYILNTFKSHLKACHLYRRFSVLEVKSTSQNYSLYRMVSQKTYEQQYSWNHTPVTYNTFDPNRIQISSNI